MFFLKIRTSIKTFVRDQRGVAAVEFGMIAPIMVLMLIGTVELSESYTVDRRVTQIVTSTADLVGRKRSVTTSQLRGMTQIVAQLMRPYDPDPVKITILDVYADPDDAGQTKVCWSYNYNGGTRNLAQDSPYELPKDIVRGNENVIVVEAEYLYHPPVFQHFMSDPSLLKKRFFLKPRLSNSIEYNGRIC